MKKQLTRANIAYDLTISPHRLTLKYDNSNIEYVFSSALYRTKFLQRLEDNRSEVNNLFTKKIGIDTNFNLLADIRLYKNIEKRGFLIIQDGEQLWENKLTFAGEKVTSKN